MADVKPIKITADVSQAEAEFQRLKAAYGEVTEAEEKFLRKVAEAEVQLKAKKTAADGLGVSMGSLSSALRQTAQENDKHAKGIDLSKKGLRDFNDILETSTGLHIKGAGAIGETIAKLGPFAGAAIVAGFAIEQWKEREKELDEALKAADENVEAQARSIQKLINMHEELTPQEQAVMSRYREIKSEKMEEEYGKQASAIATLSVKQDVANTLTGKFGPIIQALYGPLGIAAGLWSELTGKVEEYDRQMERLTNAQRATIGSDEERERLRAEVRAKADAAWLASLPKQERAMVEHTRRMDDIEKNRINLGQALTERALKEEKAAWDRQVDQFAEANHRKTVAHAKEAEARAARARKEAEDEARFHEQARQRHEKILQAEGNFVRNWNGQIRAERDREEKQRNDAAMRELKYFENQGKEILMRTRQTRAQWRAQDLLAERKNDRQLLQLAGATNEELRAYDAETHRMKMQQMAAEVDRAAQVAQAGIGIASGVFGKNKGFAIANAVINTAQGATKAYADWGMPMGVIMAAAVIAAGIAQVREIQNAKPDGQAHSGMGEVSRSGTYNLVAGEMVLDPSAANTMREVTNAMKSASVPRSNGVAVHFHGTVVGGRQAGREITKMVRSAVRSANLKVA